MKVHLWSRFFCVFVCRRSSLTHITLLYMVANQSRRRKPALRNSCRETAVSVFYSLRFTSFVNARFAQNDTNLLLFNHLIPFPRAQKRRLIPSLILLYDL